MIYKNIEKLVLNTPNNMELGEKIRELYWRERDELEKEILRLREGTDSFDSVMANVLDNVLDNVLGFEESNEVGKRINLEDNPLTPKRLATNEDTFSNWRNYRKWYKEKNYEEAPLSYTDFVETMKKDNDFAEAWGDVNVDDWNQRVRCKPTLISGSYKDELPPSDYQLDN